MMIRAIRREEIEPCVELIRSSFRTVADEYGFTSENAPRFTAFATTADRLAGQYEEGRPMYVCLDDDGGMVGYYSLHLLEGQECELNNLCVLPECRHRRIGRNLFWHAVTIAAEKGCTKMKLGIVEENQKLRAWYEGLGARHVGTEKFDFFPFTCGYLEKEIEGENIPGEGRQCTEFWDAYLEDGTLAGCDLIRGEKMPRGLRHTVVEVFVRHRDGDFLLMQRDFAKPNAPGLWESGAGGSVFRGEKPLDAAVRELYEETGIRAKKEELQSIYRAVSPHTIYWGYLCVTDIPKEEIRLQPGETIAYRWVDRREFLNMFYSDEFVARLRDRLHIFITQNIKK